MNLAKEVRELCTGKCKTLTTETEDDVNKWKDIVCFRIGRILSNSAYFPKQATDSKSTQSTVH